MMKQFVSALALILAPGLALAQLPARTLPEPLKTTVTDQQQPSGKKQPMAKSEDEYKAFQDAMAKVDGAQAEAAAAAFVKKYPKSDLKGVVYQHVMLMYQNAHNNDKTIETGRKTLEIEPTNGPALAIVASTLAMNTKDNDPDRDKRFAEARTDADKVVQLAATGSVIPLGTPASQVEAYKAKLLSMTYAALGTMDISAKNYAAAEQDYRKALASSPTEVDPVSAYRLAWVLQKESKNQEALDAAKKCVSTSNNLNVTDVCSDLVSELQKTVGSGAAATAQPK